MHIHTAAAQDKLPRMLRLARWLGADVTTMQTYEVMGPGLSVRANWCPMCQRGEMFGSGHRQAITSLMPVIGTEVEPPVGRIGAFHARLR